MITNPAMLANIALNRFDNLPRLVYADWLDEQGDDDATRTAEFIRVGVALAESKRPAHRSSVECDCDHCRLVRRHTELHDAGASYWNTDVVKLTHLGFEEVYQPVINLAGGFVNHFRAAFRKGIVLTTRPKNLTRLAHAVGQAFRLMPIGSASIQFRNRASTRREVLGSIWVNWRVDVAALTMPKDNSFRVSALVGPVTSRGEVTPTFTCEYLTNHVKRIPHLARVAARRCLINRHGTPVPRRHAADIDPR